MLLFDFLHAGLPVPAWRFHDTIPFAKAHVRAPAYRLDVLAQTLGVIGTARGLHGALEDAAILAGVVERIEVSRPGALGDWLTRTAPLSPLPKSWPAETAPDPAP